MGHDVVTVLEVLANVAQVAGFLGAACVVARRRARAVRVRVRARRLEGKGGWQR